MWRIGIDIGTTSICGVIVKSMGREMAGSITLDNPGGLPSFHPWERLQDPDAIVRTVKEVLGRLKPADEPVSAIGITGQMHGILYIDDRGNAVSPLFTWQDQRAGLAHPDGGSHADRLGRLTGHAAPPGYGMATHDYNRQNGLVPPDAAAFCTIGDYAAMKLARLSRPVMDPTNAAGLGLFNLEALVFDLTALQAAEIDPGLLPRIAASGSVIGRTEDGIPVCCALGDNQASFLGAVPDIGGSLLVNIGTGSQISLYSAQYIRQEGLETRPFPGGGYLLVGASLSGGKSYALLESFFREVCLRFGSLPGDGPLYEIMNRMAEEELPPGTGLHVDTRFYGSRSEPDRLGEITGLSPDSFTPQHLVSSILDGMVRELRSFYDRMPEEIRKGIRNLIVSGNGVRRNAALQARLEKAFGLSLRMPPFLEEASVGAALCAGDRKKPANLPDPITP